MGELQIETPGDSGLFDTDDEDQVVPNDVLEFKGGDTHEMIPYEPTPGFDVGGEMGGKVESIGWGVQ